MLLQNLAKCWPLLDKLASALRHKGAWDWWAHLFVAMLVSTSRVDPRSKSSREKPDEECEATQAGCLLAERKTVLERLATAPYKVLAAPCSRLYLLAGIMLLAWGGFVHAAHFQ